MSSVLLDASQDPGTGQIYVPPRSLAADGSLRGTVATRVPARGSLFCSTTFNGQTYGIVELDCGARIQVLLESDTTRIGDRVTAQATSEQGEMRFGHE